MATKMQGYTLATLMELDDRIKLDAEVYDTFLFKIMHMVNRSSASPYLAISIEGKSVLFHRVLMGAEAGQEVDHINRNTLDNRLSNLRIVTKAQNLLNKGLRSDNTSGYRGVSMNKQLGKWEAYINVIDPFTSKSKRKFLGYYKTPEEAAAAYNRAASTYHGEYAKLNA